MSNLLEETLDKMEKLCLTHEDVVYVGCPASGEYFKNFEEFSVNANKGYNSGFGCCEVNLGLHIGFLDGSYFERWEYDGSEGWRHVAPINYKSVSRVNTPCIWGGYA